MRINELEDKTGLDRATIRYYEKEGMIIPLRHDNGYRDYSQEDLNTLTKIKLLRQLGMSLDQIRQLQQGSGDLQTAIQAQMQKLADLRDHSQRAIQICQLMRDDGATYINMDAEYYLRQLKTMAIQYPQNAALPSNEFKEVVWREWHPAKRFLARMTDQLLMVLGIVFFQAVILKTGLNTVMISPFSFLSYLLIIPFESICIHFFGATLGKYLFGIKIQDIDGSRLSLRDSFSRAWEVFHYGLGFGIPIWSIWRLYKSCQHYNEYEMDWDYDCEVSYPTGLSRFVATIITVILSIIMIIVSIHNMSVPQNTDKELTVKEFSENYNYFWKKFGNDTDWQLNTDGTFLKTQHTDNVIVIGGKLEFDHFVYDFDGNHINKVTYCEEIFDFIWYDCIPERGLTAAMALFSAKAGETESSTNTFRVDLEKSIRSTVGNGQAKLDRTFGNIHVIWSLDYRDARPEGGVLLPKETDDSKPYAKVVFEVIVNKP